MSEPNNADIKTTAAPFPAAAKSPYYFLVNEANRELASGRSPELPSRNRYLLVVAGILVFIAVIAWYKGSGDIYGIAFALLLLAVALLCLGVYFSRRAADKKISNGRIITGTINRADGKTVTVGSKNGPKYFFETKIHYYFLGPDGQGLIQHTATVSESDSNHKAVPKPGREVAILYLDKTHYELL